MMTINQVLEKFFKLPPAVKMLLAVAGFGSLASVIFFVLPALRDPKAKWWLIAILGVGIALTLLIWGIRKLLGRKKAVKLAGALDAQGPTRGDVAEQEQIYREKFRAKLADLKSNGLSVYNLPWFVLMGEPGCGKTATLINSGLDFPLGKDEVPGFGGTRNYNWWFTNQAVILDTAGRIAFQEEGTTDKVEWEYFCKLLRQNRPRCPINGIIVAIPADKLLRDTAEERERKASILRERLRQVHQLLGVRFPTFVIVTKMDLVGGFNEFFEEVRVDLQQRNQMFGWSRPGEFQSPYDPATFTETFDEVYRRLREWAMRYLQRKATDDELGMVVTFPESFRQLRGRLNDYISTIFQKSPLLEPPFFRGFYFTSAVQEGAPIFDVFSKARGGSAVAARPARAVDSKAFFIHDFYEKKVFPEHGLVFRSAKHVTLNKRMRRMVWFGTAGMTLLLGLFFLFGYLGFAELVKNPRQDCIDAAGWVKGEKGPLTFEGVQNETSIKLAQRLVEHREKYRSWKSIYARMLFIFGSPSEPAGYIEQVHAHFVLEAILRPTLKEFGDRVLAEKLPLPDTREPYVAALRQYAQWYGEVVAHRSPAIITRDTAAVRSGEFNTILASLSVAEGTRIAAVEQVKRALESLGDGKTDFATTVLARRGEAARTDVLVKAIGEIERKWLDWTKLSADHKLPGIQYWFNFASHMQKAQGSYAELVNLRELFKTDFGKASGELLSYTSGIEKLGADTPPLTTDGALYRDWQKVVEFLKQNKAPQKDSKILRIQDLAADIEARWEAEYKAIEQGLEKPAPRPGVTSETVVYGAIDKSRGSLSAALKLSVENLRKSLGELGSQDPLEYYVKENVLTVTERSEANPQFTSEASVELKSDTAFGFEKKLEKWVQPLRALCEGSVNFTDLDDLSKWPNLLKDMSTDAPQDPTMKALLTAIQGKVGSDLAQIAGDHWAPKGQTFWRPAELAQLSESVWNGRKSLRGKGLMDEMSRRAQHTLELEQKGERLLGLGRLIPGFDESNLRDLPFAANRFNGVSVAAATAAPVVEAVARPVPEPPPTEAQPGGRTLRRATEPPPTPTASPADTTRELKTLQGPGSGALMKTYHTRAHLVTTLRAYDAVLRSIADRKDADEFRKVLETAAYKYVDVYFADWTNIFRTPTKFFDETTLALLEKCRDGSLTWPDFYKEATYAGKTAGEPQSLGRRLGDRLRVIAREAFMFDAGLVPQRGTPDGTVMKIIEDRLGGLDQSFWESMSQVFQAAGGKSLEGELSALVDTNWTTYAKQLEGIGPLTGEKPPAGMKAPDLSVFDRTKTGSGLQVPPNIAGVMREIAEYGQKEVLAAYLERRLAQVFATASGYPVVGAVPREVTSLDGVPNFDPPERFTEFLQRVNEFRQTYGELYLNPAVVASPRGKASLEACAAWASFLYSDPQTVKSPTSVGVKLSFDRVSANIPTGCDDYGSVYERVEVDLALLDANTGAVAKPIELYTRMASGVETATGWTHRWNLFEKSAFRPVSARATNLSPEGKSQGFTDPAMAWQLRASPWSLLLLLESRRGAIATDNKWRIPIIVSAGNVKPRGIYIIVDFERPFPGTIPPLSSPESISVKGMATAPSYLSK